MGVVHKLKQEVLDFIVETKRANPKISCRQLSVMVEDKFALHVSKSSVNNVLKKSKLSSAVGRRPEKTEEEKQFKIPETKKKQIFSEMQKYKDLKKKKNAVEKKANENLIQAKKEESLSDNKEVKPKEKKRESKKTKTAQTINKNELEYSDKIKRQRTAFFANLSELYENCGTIVFKCAEWSLSDKPFISKILQNTTEYYPSDKDDLYCESIIGSLIVNNKIIERNNFIERLYNTDDNIVKSSELKKRIEWMGAVTVSERSKIAVMNDLNQLSASISGYVVTLSDESEVYIDANFKTLSKAIETPKNNIFLNKAMAELSAYLVSNYKTPFFYGFSSSQDNEDDLDLFLKVFMGEEDVRMLKINPLDSNGAELTSFSYIPKIKRKFAVGVWPESALFEASLKGLKWQTKKELYITEIDKVFHYSEVAFNAGHQDKHSLRKIIFWSNKNDEPAGVIVVNSKDSAEYLFKKHILRWPEKFLTGDIDSHLNAKKLEIDTTNFLNSKNFTDIYKNLVGCINEVAKSRFSLNQELLSIYSLKGRVGITDNAIITYLDVPNEKNYVQIMNNINKGNINDFFGRKIFLFPLSKIH